MPHRLGSTLFWVKFEAANITAFGHALVMFDRTAGERR